MRSKQSDKFPIMSLQFLHTQAKLLLTPEYQRGPVWKTSQKQLLLDSLMHDFDVPKLYFRRIDRDGYEFEVVDGQQRLRTIFEFLDDEFKIKADADPVGELRIAGKLFSKLDTSLQMRLQQVNLDVVQLIGYSDEDIEDMFLRLQNGTTLTAAEKRKAIHGTMRDVVDELSKHKAFELVAIPPSHDGYQDAVAKVLHQLLAGAVTEIRPTSIENTYRRYPAITMDNPQVLRLKRFLTFLTAAFKEKQSPRLKKYSFVTLGVLVPELLDAYDLQTHASEFAEAYLDFELARVENEGLPENEQDSALSAFTDAARSDSIPAMKYRFEYLRDYFLAQIPDLKAKDPNRAFTADQRMAIFRRDRGACQAPGCSAICDENDFHADHVIPHSKGGATSVGNGRVLCPTCNLKLGASGDY